MVGNDFEATLPTVDELSYLPEVLTAAGIGRVFGKAKNTIMLQVYKGRLKAYRDGKIVLIVTISAVKLWGLPATYKVKHDDYQI